MMREAPDTAGALPLPSIDAADRAKLAAGDHHEPHRILGAHPATVDGVEGVLARAWHPDATGAEIVLGDGESRGLAAVGGGLFQVFLAGARMPLRYRLRFHFPDGSAWERDDPYRFLPSIGDIDLHLFAEGTHRRLWELLGARPMRHGDADGVSFAVWAPNARRVSVVGDFCRWDGRLFPMRSLGGTGIFELFVPDVSPGALYKYEMKTADGHLRLKTDPVALSMETPPGTAARVFRSSYAWGDEAWMAEREGKNLYHEPVAIYEAHLGSWARVPEEWHRPLTYREIAPRIVEHLKRLRFTHIQLLPVAEHPFAGSWGYQVTGYFAPTARYGGPDDFRAFVDHCHQNGIGVILDWVPAHFPKDDFALRRFDGTALYEHEDPRLGEHPDWGTLIFNYGRTEVRNFLLANALYWLKEYHIDGLRVDAVASMLYLDYSRKAGEWLPNIHGGRENLEAVDFIRTLNTMVREEAPGCITVAEESTAWGGVTRPVKDGGLGFTFKWNMGWMHDTLLYFSKNPVHRKYHQDTLTFAMLYEYTEKFIMPLSHDEVVHGKGALLTKMPGDPWQRFANLRLLLAYQFTRPGKKLLFMGTELAPSREWHHDSSLDWHLAEDPLRRAFGVFMEDLGALYRAHASLWRHDHEPEGFRWIDCSDRHNCVLAYVRQDGEAHLVVALNNTPVPRGDYRIGVPRAGAYYEILSTDNPRYGGSQYETLRHVRTEGVPWHGYPQSIRLNLPPLGVLILAPGD